jgi:hypothetical protein
MSSKKLKENMKIENYELLLDELMEKTRNILLEIKKEARNNNKTEAKENLFDQFMYINSLKNSATTTEAYQEAYDILKVSIKKFHEHTA